MIKVQPCISKLVWVFWLYFRMLRRFMIINCALFPNAFFIYKCWIDTMLPDTWQWLTVFPWKACPEDPSMTCLATGCNFWETWRRLCLHYQVYAKSWGTRSGTAPEDCDSAGNAWEWKGCDAFAVLLLWGSAGNHEASPQPHLIWAEQTKVPQSLLRCLTL